METIKNAWAQVVAHKKISIAVAVVIVLSIIGTLEFMLNGLLKREHPSDLLSDQERVSL